MFNQALYDKKRELLDEINQVVPSKEVNIIFFGNEPNWDKNYFFCYFYDDDKKIDYNMYVYIDEKTGNITYKINTNREVEQSLERWLNTEGKNAFAETYKLLKPLSQSEQLAFGAYYYI